MIFRKKAKQPWPAEEINTFKVNLEEMELEMVAAETELEFMKQEQIPLSSAEAYEFGVRLGVQVASVEWMKQVYPMFRDIATQLEVDANKG